MKLQILFIALFSVASVWSRPKEENESKIWALLVAGSNGWYNYRHQADICHSYQILHKHGVPDERIVVMMYDDLAHNSANPTPGVVINKPNGPDVYHGVLKDYTGDDVTPENFLKILRGDKEGMSGIGSGKVIESGPNDHVFVYFADHGAPGIVAFPSGSELTATDLNKAITYMHQNKRYQQMVVYIEACESGSMFKNLLPSDIKVFATTAANSEESSYACYYDSKRGTYLGDVYSVKWMEDSDAHNLEAETLQKQFQTVKEETTTSHVQEFGDMSINSDPLGMFQGSKDANYTIAEKDNSPISDAVPAHDVKLAILRNKLKEASGKEEAKQIMMLLQDEHKTRFHIENTVKQIVKKLVTVDREAVFTWTKPAGLYDRSCYEGAVKAFRKACFNFTKYEYALRQVFVLSNLCDRGIPAVDIETAIYSVCS